MSQSTCGQCGQDITGLDHRGHCPAVVGDRVRFAEERQAYTVRAANRYFSILTKPMNARHTVTYTIVSMIGRYRGTENLILCGGFETDEQCARALHRLTVKSTEISHRNRVKVRFAQ